MVGIEWDGRGTQISSFDGNIIHFQQAYLEKWSTDEDLLNERVKYVPRKWTKLFSEGKI